MTIAPISNKVRPPTTGFLCKGNRRFRGFADRPPTIIISLIARKMGRTVLVKKTQRTIMGFAHAGNRFVEAVIRYCCFGDVIGELRTGYEQIP